MELIIIGLFVVAVFVIAYSLVNRAEKDPVEEYTDKDSEKQEPWNSFFEDDKNNWQEDEKPDTKYWDDFDSQVDYWQDEDD